MAKTIKYIIAIIVVSVIALGAWWTYKNSGGQAPLDNQPAEEGQEAVELNDDTTQSINATLEKVDISDVDSEFKDIDQTINQL